MVSGALPEPSGPVWKPDFTNFRVSKSRIPQQRAVTENIVSERVHPLTYVGSLVASAAAALFLIWLVYFKPAAAEQQAWVAYLPWCNAFFNSLSAYQLVRGWRAIKARQIPQHRYHMLAALASSSLFLVSYILYHSLHGDTKFPKDLGWIRLLYLAILASHVSLSILVLPVILTTFALAFLGKFSVHPRFGRVALPVWLYVSVTGVIIVLFLKAFV
jgi:putative membrane protein